MLIAASIVLLLGTALLIKGLRGRRIGNELRCRTCSYNLTGVESANCPECGRSWTPATIARGLRKRKPAPILIGALLVLTGAAFVYAGTAGARIDTYRLLPTRAVSFLAERGSIPAINELRRRHSNRSLTPSELSQIADTALRIQSSPELTPATWEWISLLEWLSLHGDLTPAQSTQFDDQMIHSVSLRVRPRVRHGDPLPMEVLVSLRAPPSSYARISADIVNEDDAVIASADFPNVHSPNVSLMARAPTAPLKIGEQSIRLRTRVRLRRQASADEWATTASHEQSVLTTTRLEVLPPDRDSVEYVSDPDFDQFFLRDARYSVSVPHPLAIMNGTFLPDHEWNQGRLRLDLTADRPAPCDAAFQVRTIQPDGTRITSGPFIVRKGQPFPATLWSADFARDFRPGNETLELRSDIGAAAATVDVNSIWKGVIPLETVRLSETPTPARVKVNQTKAETPRNDTDRPKKEPAK